MRIRPAAADRRTQERDRARQAAADPGRPDAGRDVEPARLRLVGPGVTLDERQPVGDAELRGPRDRRAEEHRAEVDADAARPEPLGPAAEELALPAGEVEHARPRGDARDLAEQPQLLLGERVEDPVVGLGDLVVAQRHRQIMPPGVACASLQTAVANLRNMTA